MAAVKQDEHLETPKDSFQDDNVPVIHLSERDSILVVNALRHPPKPTEALREAMRRYYKKP